MEDDQDTVGELEDEGIPELDDPPPGMETTGGDYEADPVPRDHPIAATDFGTTAAEELAGEPIADSVRREVPDVRPWSRQTTSQEPAAGRLVADDTDGGGLDEYGTDTGEHAGLSAEESAMHIEEG